MSRFWVMVANLFNDKKDTRIDEEWCCAPAQAIARFQEAGFNPEPTRNFAIATKMAQVFKDLRTELQKTLTLFRRSGNGDGSLVRLFIFYINHHH